jgi:membrane-associated phospholipid phosphatase
LAIAPLHFGWKEWTITGASIAATSACFFADQSVRTYLINHKSKTRDAILPWEYYGSGYTAVAIGAGMYTYGLGWSNSWWRETGRELLTALVIESISGEILKIGLGRFRPYTNRGPATFHPLTLNDASASLPSGHTMTAFVLSAVLSERINNPYISCGLYGCALLTATERIYSDNHWLSDAVLGAILGTAIGRFIASHNSEDAGSMHTAWKIGPSFTSSGAGLALIKRF